ncbi:hypothetical protein GGR51DRAFT_513053 [Nemania sp. FL0031]|nr:hypothetical protein GGR51DRAFT_513053 [Nemania sp. FL0031]
MGEGIVGTAATLLGDVTNVTYQAFPAGYSTRFHRAPFNHWGILLSGTVTIIALLSYHIRTPLASPLAAARSPWSTCRILQRSVN